MPLPSDPAGFIEAYGPAVGPILAAIRVVLYPVLLIYTSLLIASALGGPTTITLGPGAGQAILIFLAVAAVAVLIALVVGAVVLGCLLYLFVTVLRGWFEPAPVNEPWVPLRTPRDAPAG